MPNETSQQKNERQARLSHAMGVMFLKDKVDKLEQDVSKITYPHGIHKTRSGPAAHVGTTNTRHDATVRPQAKPRAVTGPGLASTADAAADRITDTQSKFATSIRLIDASVLIFSLRSVHNWSRDGVTCVIIPLEAINTLDLLKKGDEPINLAARKATRWLEDKIAISTQDGDAMLTEPLPGIFAQKEHFRATAAQIAKSRESSLAARQTDSDHNALESGGTLAMTKDSFSAADAPRYMRELLSVCHFCYGTASSIVNFAVAIAYPPAHLHDKMLEAQAAISDQPSYLNRTDGRATEAWLGAYRIPFEVVVTSKTWTGEKPSSRFRGERISGDHNIGSSEDLLASWHELRHSRGKSSPTPSVASSSGSFKSEWSGLSMTSSHKSPRLRQELWLTSNTAPHGSVRGMSTVVGRSGSATDVTASTSSLEMPEAYVDDDDEKGPIIARPSSAASSHTSFVSTLTTSTQEDCSSQTSTSFTSRSGTSRSGSSRCATRIVRHAPSASPTRPAPAIDASTTVTSTAASSPADEAPRLNSRTLHKTRSGAEKMEEYLRSLEAGAIGGGDRRSAAATPTPGASRNG